MVKAPEMDGRSARRLMWGRMADLDLPSRIAALVFVVTAIVSMSFTQLGFWPVGVIDEKPVYLMLLLGPLIMGAFMFGPITGALLGLGAGVVVYAHATVFPLDYYEVYFMTPLNTFGLLTFLGLLAGLLFSLLVRKNRRGVARIALIVAISILLSLTASTLVMANIVAEYGGLSVLDEARQYLFNSPLGIAVQAVIDAALIALLCLVADHIVRSAADKGIERALFSRFRNWMLLVSAIVFMLASAVVFTANTIAAQHDAGNDMRSESSYLANQLNMVDRDTYKLLLEGYDISIDGFVVITDKRGFILETDDERSFEKGANLLDELGYEIEKDETGGCTRFLDEAVKAGVENNDTVILQANYRDGVRSLEFLFLVASSFDDGYAVVMRPTDLVYTDRFGTMFAITALAILLIAAIGALATVLLNRLVVRRIDETNHSLEKITNGDLGERVAIDDSREFKSLSRGINTTVSALKDTIEEVKQHNAQDLATAKTIQESSLPREFPPFPHIDKFDIYASMKTAKEVGGDFYDFFLIGDDGKLGFIMADVSGKGIPAALFMMTAKTQIQNYLEAGLPAGEAVDAANHQLCIGNDAGMFVTMWVGVLDYGTGHVDFVNAGHNPPLLLHGGSWEWVKDVSGMPLGLFDGIPYDSYTLQLAPGDMLYLYTDGVTEAIDVNGNFFGEDRLEEVLTLYKDMNPRSVGVGVRRAITDFTLDAEQSDDITMLIMKYGVPPEKKAVMVLPAVDSQLIHVCNFIHEELHRRGAPKSAYNPLDIAAEELFVNVCHYAYPNATPDNPGEARISFEYEASPPSLTVQIADDGIPYNPLAKPDAVTPDNIADVPIGGLGILMAKQSVDDMSYERIGESNVVTFVKQW